MKKYISFSGGVESTTIAVLFGAVATPIFADTGFEHDKLYERLDLVEAKLKEFHGEGFEIVKVKADVVYGHAGMDTLPKYISFAKYYPSINARFCTAKFKIEPIDNFLKSEGECELMIGLNFDEADDRTGNHGLLANVNYSYPLVELGFNRAKCIEILKQVGLEPHFPPYMQRGGCIGCFYKSKKEYQALALMNPEEFDLVADLEQSIQDKRGTFYHIHPQIPNLREFKKQAINQLFTAAEMYPRERI